MGDSHRRLCLIPAFRARFFLLMEPSVRRSCAPNGLVIFSDVREIAALSGPPGALLGTNLLARAQGRDSGLMEFRSDTYSSRAQRWAACNWDMLKGWHLQSHPRR